MVTETTPITFEYSHTIGRQENRSGSGFFYPVAITRDEENQLYVLSRGSETPAFFPCKRVTVFTIDDEELIREFGTKVSPEEADASAPDGSFMWPTSVALDSQGTAYVADEWINRISVFDKDGECVSKWGTLGDGDGQDTIESVEQRSVVISYICENYEIIKGRMSALESIGMIVCRRK